jgi:hypothetical protein
MKVRNADRESAGILVVVIVMCGIVGASLVAYLGMVSSQERFVHRSATWNSCIAMCESGIEEALAHINHRDTGSNFGVYGWSPASAGAFCKTQFLNRGRCEMAISTNYPPIITVTSKFPGPLGMGEIKRSVRVETTVKPPFPQLILSKSRVTLNGNGRIDSYNSTNRLVESGAGGEYVFALATAKAVVASLTRSTDFSIGNVDIWGYVATGPGAVINIGPGGVVGDRLYCLNPLNGNTIQAGHKRTDFNVYVPDAALPRDFETGRFFDGPVTNAGVVYRYVARTADYTIPVNFSMSTGEKLLITGAARILARRDVTLNNDAEILLGTNATVEWYQEGSNVSLGGRGVVNTRGFAKDFQLIGLPTCTSINYNGSFQFIGTVYAPSATVTVGGSADAFGALVGNAIELTGDMSLHYDEALNEPRKARFLASSWREINL